MWKLLAILWVAVSVLGCTSTEGDKTAVSSKQVTQYISEEYVVTAAKKYLDERNINYENTRIKAEWHADVWWVMFSTQIPKPGGDFVVLVSHEGNVVEIVPGE